MENFGLVSLVVPVYNTEAYLAECLTSLCKQTYKNIEIIIVDDGSTDGSPAICDDFAERYGFISVVHKKNEGVSVARNTGMDIAKGKYISFIDGDDLIDLAYCEKLVACAEKNTADIVVCDYKSFSEAKGERASSLTERVEGAEAYKKVLLLRSLYREYGGHIPNGVVAAGATLSKFYRLDFLRRAGTRFIPGLVRAEDCVFWINTLIKTDKVVHLAEPLYSYRQHNQSLCGGSRFFADSEAKFGKLLVEYEKFIVENADSDEFRAAYYCRVVEVIFWHWKHNYFNNKNKKRVLTRVGEFSRLMKTEPYNTALKNVDKALLNRRQRALVTAYRCHAVSIFLIAYRLMEKLKG